MRRPLSLLQCRPPRPMPRCTRVETPIRCVETHISWVFLTGPYAYKVKKPLRLQFPRLLDRGATRVASAARNCGSIADTRRTCTSTSCRSAAARRRRVSARRPAPAFEHALRMVQFDPDYELSQLLRRDAVDGRRDRRARRDLARMHAAGDSRGRRGPFGAPAAVHRVTLDNFAELGARVAGDARGSTSLASCVRDVERAFRRELAVADGGASRATAACASATATCTAATSCAGADAWSRSTAWSSTRPCASSTSRATSRSCRWTSPRTIAPTCAARLLNALDRNLGRLTARSNCCRTTKPTVRWCAPRSPRCARPAARRSDGSRATRRAALPALGATPRRRTSAAHARA